MVDDLLSEHIEELDKGLSRSQVRSLLLKAGWPDDVVKEYLDSVPLPTKGVVLQVRGVSKFFGKACVINTVDFDVRAGEIFGIIGMSGAGKSTLLNLLAGYLIPERGDIVLSCNDAPVSVVRSPVSVRRLFGFSTQTPSFYDKLTVLENLEHFGILYGLRGRVLHKRARELLKLVGLEEYRHLLAGNLSGGMQKRLDIACAIVHSPSILFLDEPTADLDPVTRKQLWELITDINKQGTTIVVASHFLDEMESLCSRIAVLVNHRIVEIGSADELRKVYGHNFDVSLELESNDLSKIESSLKSYSPSFEGKELKLQTSSPEDILPIISKNIKSGDLRSLRIERPSLGKVFEVLVKK